MKKIIGLSISLSLILPSGALFGKERQGAQLEITKTDGTDIKGELIAITPDSILVLEGGLNKSIKICDISVVTVVKSKSKAGDGALVGGVLGGLLSFFDAVGNHQGAGLNFDVGTRIAMAAFGTCSLTGIGALIGSGSKFKVKEVFPITGKSDSEIKEILTILRKKARFPDYQ